MQTKGINHVNIVTADVDGTVRFYAELLGLRAGQRPQMIGVQGAWLYDANDHPIIHLLGRDAQGEDKTDTGAIDHVAFTCDDYDGALERCGALGLEHLTRDFPDANFRQIVVTDPNAVMLELNFAGG